MTITDTLRQWLERNYRLTPQEWQRLTDEGVVTRYASSRDTEEVCEALDKWRDETSTMLNVTDTIGPRGPSTLEALHQARATAVSRVIAHLAARLPEVEMFRDKVLSNALLDVATVDSWVTARAREEGAGRRPARLLAFAVPVEGSPGEVRTEHHVVTQPNGVLERLRQLSERLAATYGWLPAQATLFVLTDRAPLVDTITVAHTKRGSTPVINRITLVVDPALPPHVVTAHYRRARKQEFGKTRPRVLTRKHLQLGAFAAMRPQNQPWSERLAEWNASVPITSWRYRREGTFRRDCLLAATRLLRLDERSDITTEAGTWHPRYGGGWTFAADTLVEQRAPKNNRKRKRRWR
jgi:hypothetical protein